LKLDLLILLELLLVLLLRIQIHV